MKNNSTINEIKNKFRGIVSVFRSKEFVKNKRMSGSSILRQSIKCLYMDCRVKVPESDFYDVISWVNKNIRSQIPEYYNTPVGYEELRFRSAGVNSALLSTEINWIVNRLSFEYQNINKYISYKQIIEKLILQGKYQKAIECLDKKEKDLGASLWSIQLKISLLQTLKGLEGQKQYSAEVRNVWPGGVLSYITYFTSVRNEDRTSLEKFNSDMNIKLNGQNVDEDFREHLNYHITSEIPKDEKGICQLLKIEQLGTIYDLYESLITIATKLLNPNNIIDGSPVFNGLKKIIKINDTRLLKINFHQADVYDFSKFKKRSSFLSDKVLSGDNVSVLKILKKSHDDIESLHDVWNYIYLGVWRSLSIKRCSRVKNKPHNLGKLIGSALTENEMSTDIDLLMKLSVNYNGLNVFCGIKEFLDFVLKSTPNYKELWSLHLVGLYSDYFGIEDLPLNSNEQVKFNIDESVTSVFWRESKNTKEYSFEKNSISIIKSLKLLSKNNFHDCLQSLPVIFSIDLPQPYRLLYCQMKLFALSQEGRRSDIINLVNETVPYSKDILDIVNFHEFLKDFEYCDFESTDNALNAPVALFVAWFKTDDSKLLSHLRIATKKSIKKLKCDKPSKINKLSYINDSNQLVLFLRYICIPNIIDNIRSLKGTKGVLNERQDICRLLNNLDPYNEGFYKAEIENIEDELLMEEGKRVVDRTRIYVDMDAHTRWVFKELQEDYGRYKDLLDININGTQDYKEILDDYINSENPSKTAFIPDNEADAVLLAIVAKASNDFLTNPKYGLDYYLSKRIRHQSFIGLIRSHLEFSELITTRESEDKEFEYNHYWINKFKSLNQSKKDELNKLLSIFAKGFDNELIYVRDNVFQLNTEECPSGLIKIDFSVQVMSLLKHFIIEGDALFSDFVYFLNTFMWVLLQPSLDKTKSFIKDDLKPSIMHSADKLKANTRKLAGNDSAFDDFELKLTDQTASVQRSLEDVMAWFTPLIGVSDDRFVLSVEKALDLSINAALDMLKPFKPNIKINIVNSDDIHLHQQELTFVNDTIFILLDNIKAHSGVKFPEIYLNIDVDADTGRLTISCSNETKKSERARLLVEINKIKQLIFDDKLGNRAKLEGRSGFIKLAASIDKSSKGNLSFDLNIDGDFCLSITNDIRVEQVPFNRIEVECV